MSKEGFRLEGTLDFDYLDKKNFLTLIMVQKLTQSLKNFEKILFRHAKAKSLANFDISNAPGEN